MPRRLGGTVLIIAAVLGLLNMPDATPTMNSHNVDCQYGESTCSVVIPARPTAPRNMPQAASVREPRLSAHQPAIGDAISIPSAIGVILIPAVIGSSPCAPWK